MIFTSSFNLTNFFPLMHLKEKNSHKKTMLHICIILLDFSLSILSKAHKNILITILEEHL